MLEFRTVLCPVDFSPLSKSALQLAIAVSQKLRARLVLEHNLEGSPVGYLGVSWMWEEEHDRDSPERRVEWATERLRELFREIPEGVPHEAKLTRGTVDESLRVLEREIGVDLVVMGTHGPTSAAHDSRTERAILELSCPVLCLGEDYDPASVMSAMADKAPETLNVVLSHDLRRRGRETLRFALALGERMPHHLAVLHVVPEAHGRHKREKRDRAVLEARQRLEEQRPEAFAERMSVHVGTGHEAAEVLALAKTLDAIFILMPAQGRSSLRRHVFGTSTLEVLHGADCPVLFLPPAYRLARRDAA